MRAPPRRTFGRIGLDSLASIANFLKFSGWEPRLPWGVEVVVPRDVRLRRLRSRFLTMARAGLCAGRRRGAAGERAGEPLSAGRRAGPGLSHHRQFRGDPPIQHLRRLCAVGGVAGRPDSRPHAPSKPWPKKVTPLTTAECKTMQRLLTTRGFYHGTIDGKLGRTSRNAVHAFQLRKACSPPMDSRRRRCWSGSDADPAAAARSARRCRS